MKYITRRLSKTHPRIWTPDKKKISESARLDGVYKMYSIENNIKTQIDEKHNLIMDDAHNVVAKIFMGFSAVYYYQIKYLAIGDDNTAVTGTDSTLTNEVYRVPFVVQANSSSKVVTTDFYITDSEFSGTIEELGIPCGVTASSTADTGYLLSHVLWSYSKSSSEEILVEYQLTIS